MCPVGTTIGAVVYIHKQILNNGFDVVLHEKNFYASTYTGEQLVLYYTVIYYICILLYKFNSLIWLTGFVRGRLDLFPSTKVNNMLDKNSTVDLVFFGCLDFREFVIVGLFTKSRIQEFAISLIGIGHNNNFREILKFGNLSSSQNSQILKSLVSDLQ